MRGPSGLLSSSRLVGLLRNQLLREKSDYLLFRVLRVEPVCECSSLVLCVNLLKAELCLFPLSVPAALLRPRAV